jgi:hypothetical protein
LELREATQGHEDDIARQTTRWRIAQVSPGETVAQQLNFQCLNPDPQGVTVRATVTSQQTSAVANQAATVIASNVAPSTPQPSAPPASQPPATSSAGGGLRITASALANPIMAGSATTLLISLTNERGVPDQDIALSVVSSGDGLSLRVLGPTPTPAAATSNSAIDFQPVREMRPSETLSTPYRLEVRGVRPGRYVVRSSVTSSLQRQPVIAETEFVVNGP